METATYFLPRLVSVEPMTYGDLRLIHSVIVHRCEPKDLPAVFTPVLNAKITGDRVLLPPCKGHNGSGNRNARAEGEGNLQKPPRVKNGAGINVAEKKTPSFTSGDTLKLWLKAKQEAIDAHVEKLLRKATGQESAADLRREDEEPERPAHPPATVSTPSPKRAAPVSANRHCPKRARVAVPSPPVAQHQQYYSAAFAGAHPAAEAIDDIDLFRCALEGLLDCCRAREKERTQPVLDEILGGPAPELQAVWPIEQELPIAAKEETYSWALLRRYRQRPIFRLDQLDGYQEFVSYTLNLEGCNSGAGIFDTKFFLDYTALY